MSIPVTTSVDEDLVQIIDRIAKEEGLDRATVIRKFLHRAVSEWLIEKSLKDYEDGKLTLWQAAKRCNLSLWEMINEVKKRSIHVPYTLEFYLKIRFFKEFQVEFDTFTDLRNAELHLSLDVDALFSSPEEHFQKIDQSETLNTRRNSENP